MTHENEQMTLRDRFAESAWQTFINMGIPSPDAEIQAYQRADAMLKAREQADG